MANQIPLFFFAPTWDYPPGGPIRLGNVITSLKKPEQPLFRPQPPTDGDVITSEKRRVEYSREKLELGKFSILTRFFNLVGFDVDFGAEINRSDEEIYHFDLIETTQFAPRPEYLQKCIEAEDVRLYLQRSRYRKPLYIITGLKVVHGARADTFKSRATGGLLAAKSDMSSWSGGTIPIQSSLKVEGKVGNKSKTTWEGSSNFVFAFRVRKIRVSKKTGTVKSDEDYKKGAFFGKEIEQLNLPELIISREEDPDADDEGFAMEELMEDEDLVACAFLTKEDPTDSQ
ncbi:hypothetical protein EDB81DRAFT_710785 [Dactylonectria macrodidyma]|uniref:Uncharacterized protein n=1 Tax=Dactylonectria macrodidyma TaxID=307937 RepID=A0A9P9FKB8_9HYPO|nr:hypothetical protein EDB81DRAFT_710785 [Dactylonectria macrodidyma]